MSRAASFADDASDMVAGCAGLAWMLGPGCLKLALVLLLVAALVKVVIS